MPTLSRDAYIRLAASITKITRTDFKNQLIDISLKLVKCVRSHTTQK